MTTQNDLNAEIAQQLFGWTLFPGDGWWQDGNGRMHRHLPSYTTDPAATAQVWQWLEQQEGGLLWIEFQYRAAGVACYPMNARHEATGSGTTWPEALCRAALALALAEGRQ